MPFPLQTEKERLPAGALVSAAMVTSTSCLSDGVACSGFLHDCELSGVEGVQGRPPGVRPPFVQVRIVREGRFLGLACGYAVEPLHQMLPLDAGWRREVRHVLDVEDVEPARREVHLLDAPQELSANDESVGRSRLDAGRVDVAHVRVCGEKGRADRQEQCRDDPFHA